MSTQTKNISVGGTARAVEVINRENCRGDRVGFFKDVAEHVRLLKRGPEREALLSWAEKGVENQKDESRAADLVALREAALNPVANAEAFDAYNAMVVTTVDNFVRATSNAAAFFEDEPLGEADAPYIRLVTRNEVRVVTMGEDGGVPSVYAVKDTTRIAGSLDILTTKAYTYPLVDLYTGRVADNARAQVDLGYDLAMQVNARLWPVAQAACAGFTLSGVPENELTYNLHSSIVPANIPVTNLLVTGSNSGTSKFRKDSLDLIAKYAAGWAGTDAEGNLSLVAIHLPSIDITGFLDMVDVDSRGDNPLVQQVFARGFIYNYAGMSITLIADPTLDPAAGVGYCQMSGGIGKFWTKPSMDKMLTTQARSSVQALLANEEQMLQCKVIGAMAVEPWRPRIARISYRTAA